MKREEYKGWTNWDTWKANLHLNNDSVIYEKSLQCANFGELEEFFLECFECTTCGQLVDGITHSEINFEEIFAFINEILD